jgi:hypothetical protein
MRVDCGANNENQKIGCRISNPVSTGQGLRTISFEYLILPGKMSQPLSGFSFAYAKLLLAIRVYRTTLINKK